MIVLDTQAALWSTTDQSLLSGAAERAIANARETASGIAIASTTLWEIAMLAAKGRVELPTEMGDYLNFLENRYIVLPLTAAIAHQSVLFTDRYPADPSDRLIGATASVYGLRLVTSDRLIRGSGEVECIW